MKKLLNKYFVYFVMYSVIGWCYEVFLEVVIYKWGFSNRGFLFGPYCPVYGFGALIFIISLQKLKAKKIKLWKINITPIIMFLGIMLIATSIELITSYILENATGGWLWDYTSYSFNFQGRIALNPSIRFGLGGMLFMYIIQPLFEKMTNKLGEKRTEIVSILLMVILGIDLIITLISKIVMKS